MPLKKEVRYSRIYSATRVKNKDEIPLSWDTETDGLNGELLCITYSDEDGEGIYTGHQMREQFLARLLNRPYPYVWYAHNAQYDWRYIIHWLLEQGYYIDFSNRTDSDIYQITIWSEKPIGIKSVDNKIPKIVMRDSMAIFPGSLNDFVRFYAPDHAKLHIDFDNTVFDPHNPHHVKYAINDAVILRQAMRGFARQFTALFDCSHGVTTAGCAMRAWQKSTGRDYGCVSKGEEEFIDSAYYGGLVFLTSTEEHTHCVSYDINSSYPSQMLDHPVPYGKPTGVKNIVPDKQGFYRITVTAPDDLIVPILPSRDEKGNMCWRRGRFDTTVTSVELEFALQHGYRLDEVHEGMIFPESVSPFTEFVGKCRDLRLAHKGTAVETTAKLMQNSLYGKFGARRIRKQIYLPVTPDDILSGTPVNSELGEDLGLFAREVEDEQMPRMPHWAAWITAQARLDLLTVIYAVGVEHVLYGDTDSITVKSIADTRKIPQHETEYGKYKIDKVWDVFRAHGPKVYTGKIAGQYTGKSKGIPRQTINENLLQQIHLGDKITVSYESTPKLTSILKGKESYGTGQKARERTLSALENSSNWVREGETVRPRIADPRAAAG